MDAITEERLADRVRRAGDAARAAGAESLLVGDPATVLWLTGREQEIEFGPPYPIAAGTFVQLDLAGGGRIVCPEDEATAGIVPPSLVISSYEAYTVETLRPVANARQQLALEGLVAIEAHAIPAGILEGVRWIDVSTQLRWLRAVKDPAEVAAIRRSCQVVSSGQRAFRALARPGIREIELFSAVHSEMERDAGQRVPVLPDLLSGPRLMEVGRPPTDRMLGADELVLCDLVARYQGYWADSCTTICLGTPTDPMRRLHDACLTALDAVTAAARPGARAMDLDSLARSIMADAGYSYPHHTGHGVGAGYHEEPRIVPGSTAALEPGMVLALEPAGFANGIGARVEHIVLITDGGAEILTDYPTRLDA
jgi:Xaa-Pro aminopeptidase